MLEKIDHLGIAVNSIEEARQFYENVLGLHCEKIEEIASQKVRTAFFRIGDIHIELLEPTDDDSPIAKFLTSRGEGIHHVSYKSDDIRGELEKAAEAGCRLIHAEPITGAGGKQIAFLHPGSSHGVLTEFCSDPE
jgi:methylmalonyl-CoA/ethylmalonyl-CoA epimerase